MLNRRTATKTLLANRGDLLVVAGLGSPTWDVTAAGDDDRNFYFWGAMGGACMTGLGLALATIALQAPPNLAIVVLDNGRYGETGMQPSHTDRVTSLVDVAKGCGIAKVLDVGDANGLRSE